MEDNTKVNDYSSDSSTDNAGLLQKIKSKPRVAKEEESEVSVSNSYPPNPPELLRQDATIEGNITEVNGKKLKPKKPRSKKQIEAFEKARKVRADKIALKKQIADDKRAEAYLARKHGKKKLPEKREPTVLEIQEMNKNEVRSPRPKQVRKKKKVREVIQYETDSESSSTEEVVVVKKVKKNKKKKKETIQKEPKYEEDVETEIDPNLSRSSIYYV